MFRKKELAAVSQRTTGGSRELDIYIKQAQPVHINPWVLRKGFSEYRLLPARLLWPLVAYKPSSFLSLHVLFDRTAKAPISIFGSLLCFD